MITTPFREVTIRVNTPQETLRMSPQHPEAMLPRLNGTKPFEEIQLLLEGIDAIVAKLALYEE